MEKPKIDILTLSKCTVLNDKGAEVSMYDLWQKQPSIFIFLRHFACIACRTHASEVWDRRYQFESSGAKIYFIGNGSPEWISVFKDELLIKDAPIYTDPTLLSFKAAGFKRNFLSAVSPQSIFNGAKMMVNRKEGTGAATKQTGDLWQLGGTLALKTDGKVMYHHISEAFGDFDPQYDGENIARIVFT